MEAFANKINGRFQQQLPISNLRQCAANLGRQLQPMRALAHL